VPATDGDGVAAARRREVRPDRGAVVGDHLAGRRGDGRDGRARLHGRAAVTLVDLVIADVVVARGHVAGEAVASRGQGLRLVGLEMPAGRHLLRDDALHVVVVVHVVHDPKIPATVVLELQLAVEELTLL